MLSLEVEVLGQRAAACGPPLQIGPGGHLPSRRHRVENLLFYLLGDGCQRILVAVGQAGVALYLSDKPLLQQALKLPRGGGWAPRQA